MLIISTPKDDLMWDIRDGWPTWINKYLSSEDYTKLIHNALYDGSLIETQHKVRIRNIKDTMLQEKILLGIEAPFGNKDEAVKRKYSTALKYCLLRYGLGSKVEFDSKEFRDHMGPFTVKMKEYGYGDTNKMHKLYDKQCVLLRKNGLEMVADLENAALECFIRMRVDGIGFDREKWLDIADGYLEEYTEKKFQFDRMLKKEARTYNKKYRDKQMPEEINANSPKQVKELFALRGITIESYTDFRRQYSTHKVEYNDKLLDLFFEMRDYYQLSNTFGVKWLHEDDEEPTVDPFDGRVHPNFTQIISTGRSSCSNPNLQQLPAYKAKELKGGHPREAFIASKGYTMFQADYSGQEFALMMLLSGEKVWLDYIEKGYDTHSMLTEMAQPGKWKAGTEKGCEYAKTKRKCNCREHGQLRTYTKKIIFGIPYGKGITSVAEDLAIPYDEAAPIVRSILRVLPRLRRWMEQAKQKALVNKAVWTLPPFNRYRKLEFFVAPKSRFSDKEKDKEVAEYLKDTFSTKGASKDSWRRKMIAENTDWRVKNQGVNSPIQGSGADMLKMAMVLLQRYIDKHNFPARLLLPVHDAIISEAKDSHSKKWEKIVEEKMEEAAMMITNGQNIIKAEIKSGKHW